MNILSPKQLLTYNYSIHPINSLKQYWRNHKTFSCLDAPKANNIFVYTDRCKGEYKTKDGNVFFAESDSIIYAPEGSEYSARFFDFESETSNTIGINFRIFNENSKPIIMDKSIKIYRDIRFKELVKKIDIASKSANPCFARMKAGIYEIISTIGDEQSTPSGKYGVIRKGIEYLESGNFELSVSEIAAICNVSESYFRKLFREYSGLSPSEYKMNTKMKKAVDYLIHTDLNTNEIAAILNFTDASFFCKCFKSVSGYSPTDFRQNNNK